MGSGGSVQGATGLSSFTLYHHYVIGFITCIHCPVIILITIIIIIIFLNKMFHLVQ